MSHEARSIEHCEAWQAGNRTRACMGRDCDGRAVVCVTSAVEAPNYSVITHICAACYRKYYRKA